MFVRMASLVVLFGCLAGIGCGSKSGPTKAATVAYWASLTNGSKVPPMTSQSRSEAVARLRSGASHIESLPTKNVDPEAVELGLEMAAFFRNTASMFEHANASDQNLMLQTFVNGFTGDFGGGLQNIAQAQTEGTQRGQSFQQASDHLDQRAALVRSHLTGRYGVQF